MRNFAGFGGAAVWNWRRTADFLVFLPIFLRFGGFFLTSGENFAIMEVIPSFGGGFFYKENIMFMSKNGTFAVVHSDGAVHNKDGHNDSFEEKVGELLNKGYKIANSGVRPNSNTGCIRWGHFIKKNRGIAARQFPHPFFMVKGENLNKFAERVGELLEEGYEISNSGVQCFFAGACHWAHLIFVEGDQK